MSGDVSRLSGVCVTSAIIAALTELDARNQPVCPEPIVRKRDTPYPPGPEGRMHSPASPRQVMLTSVVGAILLAVAPAAHAQSAPPASPILERHEGDDYTRYGLLAPETAAEWARRLPVLRGGKPTPTVPSAGHSGERQETHALWRRSQHICATRPRPGHAGLDGSLSGPSGPEALIRSATRSFDDFAVVRKPRAHRRKSLQSSSPSRAAGSGTSQAR